MIEMMIMKNSIKKNEKYNAPKRHLIDLSFGKRDEDFNNLKLPIYINNQFDIEKNNINNLKNKNK